MRRLVFLMRLLFALGLVGIAVVVGLFIYAARDLPSYTELENYDPKMLSRVYAEDGSLMTEFGEEKRMFLPLQATPQLLIDAFVAAEDQHFYSHWGVDISGIIRAAIHNVTKSRGRLAGGSTITQQVAKNFLLTNETSIIRKIKEAILAVRIEKAFTKSKILELYLNKIFLGKNSYGIASASLNYFNKPVEELALEELAFLAGLPKAPSTYSPQHNMQRAIARRNWVLDRMVAIKAITKEQAETAKAKPLIVKKRNAFEKAPAPYYAEEVRRFLVEKYGRQGAYCNGFMVRTPLNPTFQEIIDRNFAKIIEAHDRKRGYHGPITRLTIDEVKGKPLRKLLHDLEEKHSHPRWHLALVKKVTDQEAVIVTYDYGRGRIKLEDLKWARTYAPNKEVGPEITKAQDVLAPLDLVWVAHKKSYQPALGQSAAPKETQADEFYLRQVPKLSGAIVVMDPFTGRVLAMTGGYSYKYSQFNRATQALRQCGSALKPFIYLAGLENGFTPSDVFVDEEISLATVKDQDDWSPHNYGEDFKGELTLRQALERSNNIVTIKLVRQLGIAKMIKIIRKLNINPKPQPNLSVALGSVETTLARLVAAYSAFLNGGKLVKPRFVDWIQDKTGKVVYRSHSHQCVGCHAPPELQTNIEPPKLKSEWPQVISAESASQILSILDGAVKRGSAWRGRLSNYPTAAKTGSTNNYKDAWFIGCNADVVVGVFVGYDEPTSMGKDATGSAMCGPIFKACMEELKEYYPAKPFRVPSGLGHHWVDYTTGQAAKAGDKGAILELFKPGTESVIYRKKKQDEALGINEGEGEIY